MSKRRIKTANNIGWIIIVAAIILLYSSYFLLYIPKQESLVQERGFRILEEYAQNMHNKHNYYQKHLENYSVFYAVRTLSYYDSLINHIEKDSLYLRSEDAAFVLEIHGVVDNLDDDIIIENIGAFNDSSIISRYDSKYSENLIFNLQHSSYKSNFINALDSLFELKNKYFNNNQLKQINDLKHLNAVKVPVTTLMEGLKFDKLFENIAVLDSNQVIHNSTGNVVNDITNTIALLDTISENQGGVLQILENRGEKNHVLILPVTLLNQKFYLAGFISDQAFKKKTRAINSQFLGLISGIILLLLIGMPILKIVFINRNERLNVRDAHNATVSLIISLSLLMLLFLGTMKLYVLDQSTARDRISKISSKLVSNIDNNFNELIKLCDIVVSDRSPSVSSKFIQDSLLNGKQYVKLPDNLNNQFPFNEILLMSSEGKAIKAVTKTAFSNLITLDLSDRNYFTKISDEKTSWPLTNKSFDSFYIESIKSYNTGYKETAISFRLKEELTDTFKAPYLAITSHIPALYDQILPQDVAFVVINEMGEVLFHSDQSKNLHENFLIESNNHPQIIGALKYRVNETIKINYNEKQWLARIVPLENKPLYHITLIDKEHTGNRNSRIYLFTFYLLLITFFCIVIGMQIVQRIKPSQNFLTTKSWSFKRLIFQQNNYRQYKTLLLVQSIILGGQLAGLLIINQPVIILIYQLTFIGYSGFIAMYVLGDVKFRMPSYILFAIVMILLFIFLFLNKFAFISIIIILAVLTGTFVVLQKQSKIQIHTTSEKVKKVYLAFMILWLAGLTILPVISYYQSIKLQEDKLSIRNQMLHMAHQNILRENRHEEHKGKDWLAEINGNDIDSMTISNHSHEMEKDCAACDPAKNHIHSTLGLAANLYTKLPSPITKDDYLMTLINNQNPDSTWFITDSSLIYSTAGMHGKFLITSPGFLKMNKSKRTVLTGINKTNSLYMILRFLIPIVLLSLFIWIVFQFLTGYILNTVLANWVFPKTPSWKGLMSNNQITRILLITFNGNNYLDEIKDINQSNSQSANIPKIVLANQIIDQFGDIESLVSKTDKIIWIRGLGTYIHQFENFELLLENLREIDRIATGKVIVELPYDTVFFDEFTEDYVEEFESDKNEETQIHSLNRNIKEVFSKYFRYTGKLDTRYLHPVFEEYLAEQSNNNINHNYEENLLANEQLVKLHYNYIWDNLSRMEKMILFDLAEDGMLNLKNRFLIMQLIRKGLITMNPYPEIFTPGFQYFLTYSINQEETRLLERKLGKQGKWKSMRYMILLILIPLAGFVFISQGTSIEKVVGIFTGVLALFSGSMRLMESGLFRASAK